MYSISPLTFMFYHIGDNRRYMYVNELRGFECARLWNVNAYKVIS